MKRLAIMLVTLVTLTLATTSVFADHNRPVYRPSYGAGCPSGYGGGFYGQPGFYGGGYYGGYSPYRGYYGPGPYHYHSPYGRGSGVSLYFRF